MAGNDKTAEEAGPEVSNISVRRRKARKKGAGDYEKQRQAILQAAIETFREVGYEATRMDNIAKRANLDRASVYYYFKGKKEIFREIIGETTLSNITRAEAIAASDQPAGEKIRLLIHDLFQIYEQHHPLVYIYLQEDMGRLLQDESQWARELLSLNRRFDTAVLNIVEQGVADGSFRADVDPVIAAKGMVGMCNWSHRWFEPNGKYSASEIAESFAKMVVHGLEQTDAR